MRLRNLTMLLVLPLSAVVALATTPSPETVVRECEALIDRTVSPSGPGVAVLIAHGDQVVLRTARGRAQIELGVSLSPDQVFRIASITKMFAAATVMKLVEAGKIALDDPLSKYLPDFPNGGKITIRQLLNHTAGISDTHKPDIGPRPSDSDTAAIVARIGQTPLDFEPGTRWSYSNSGFVLVGAVIEKVTGAPWYEALRKELLDPIGLKQTGYGDLTALIPGRVTGYSTDNPNRAITNVQYSGFTEPHAAGDLVSTVDDLLHWMRALADGRVISKTSFQQMMTPGPDVPGASNTSRYGFGMYLSHVRGVATIGHTGQTGGFTSSVTYVPSSGITVVLLANDDNFDARVVSRRLTAIAVGEPYPDPVAISLTEQQMQALAGRYRRNPTMIETLSIRDGKIVLHAIPGIHHEMRLQMTADNQLHFEQDEFDYWVPIRDQSGKITRLDYFQDGDGPPVALERLNE